MNNIDLVKEYIEVVSNQGKVDNLDKYIAPHFQTHSLHINPEPIGDTQPKNLKEAFTQAQEVFSNQHKSIDDIFTQDDKVVVRWTTEAIHTGNFKGISPTNKKVKYSGIDIYRLVDGKIIEQWYVWDRLALYQQLGLI